MLEKWRHQKNDGEMNRMLLYPDQNRACQSLVRGETHKDRPTQRMYPSNEANARTIVLRYVDER